MKTKISKESYDFIEQKYRKNGESFSDALDRLLTEISETELMHKEENQKAIDKARENVK